MKSIFKSSLHRGKKAQFVVISIVCWLQMKYILQNTHGSAILTRIRLKCKTEEKHICYSNCCSCVYLRQWLRTNTHFQHSNFIWKLFLFFSRIHHQSTEACPISHAAPNLMWRLIYRMHVFVCVYVCFLHTIRLSLAQKHTKLVLRPGRFYWKR